MIDDDDEDDEDDDDDDEMMMMMMMMMMMCSDVGALPRRPSVVVSCSSIEDLPRCTDWEPLEPFSSPMVRMVRFTIRKATSGRFQISNSCKPCFWHYFTAKRLVLPSLFGGHLRMC